MFKVGDRVRVSEKDAWCSGNGNGTISQVDASSKANKYKVCYDDGQGSFWVSDENVSLLNNAKTIMQKVTSMFKVLVDKDTQILKKAGFINGDLELTSEGQSALNAVLFNANKAELVKLAQEVLDEETK